jgi:hypothetical protein
MRRPKSGGGYEYAYQPNQTHTSTGEKHAALPLPETRVHIHPVEVLPPQLGLFDLFGAEGSGTTPTEKVVSASTKVKRPKPGAIFHPAEKVKAGKETVAAPSLIFDQPIPQLGMFDNFDPSPAHAPAQPEAKRVRQETEKAAQGRPRKREKPVPGLLGLLGLLEPPVSSPDDLKLPEAPKAPPEELVKAKAEGTPLEPRPEPAPEVVRLDTRLAQEIERQQGKTNPIRSRVVKPFGGRAGWGPATRRQKNDEALALARQALKEGRQLTADEREMVASYSGAGGTGEQCFGMLNEYYTPPELAAAMWEACEKLLGGGDKIKLALEPSAGTGVFQEHAPAGCKMIACEINPESADINRALHPKHEVTSDSFERHAMLDLRQPDLVIGNPPFGSRGAHTALDPAKAGMTGEQYGLDTALDKVRDGGIVAMVLPASVMTGSTAEQQAFRERIANKAILLGAWRLPNSTFKHSGTDNVTPDVVFFRRLPAGMVAAIPKMDEELRKHTRLPDQSSFIEGNYFTANPTRILGKVEEDKQFRGYTNVEGAFTPELLEGLRQQGHPAGSAEPFSWHDAHSWRATYENRNPTDNIDTVRRVVDVAQTWANAKRPYADSIGSHKEIDGHEYVLRQDKGGQQRWRRVDDAEELADLSEPAREAVLAAKAIGEGVASLQAKIRDREDNAKINEAREKLRAQVVAFSGTYGRPAESKGTYSRISNQRTAALFAASVKPDGEVCDLLLRQVDAPQANGIRIEQTTDPAVACAHVARACNGQVDLIQAAGMLGTNDPEQVEAFLRKSPEYFPSEDGTWLDRAHFLSGYIYERRAAYARVLAILKDASGDVQRARALLLSASASPAVLDKLRVTNHYDEVVGKLEEGLKQLDEARIATPIEMVPFGIKDRWIPHEILTAFVRNKTLLNYGLEYTGGRYVISDGTRPITESDDPFWKSEAGRGPLAKAIVNYLNRDRLGDNQQTLIEGIDDDYKRWVLMAAGSNWKDQVEAEYNLRFHGFRQPPTSQDALPLDHWNHSPQNGGTAEGKTPRGHQYQASRWVEETPGGKALCDNTGVGKTLEIIAAIAHARHKAVQTGGKFKPIVCVPKALLENWKEEIRAVQPDAKILLIGEKTVVGKAGKRKGKTYAEGMTAEDKAKAWADASLNDYDYILCSREAYAGLPVSPETKEKLWEKYAEADVAYGAEKKEEEVKVKEGESDSPDGKGKGKKKKGAPSEENKAKKKERLKAKWAEEDAERKKLGSPLFEDLNVDGIYFDEAHAYKNLFVPKGKYSAVKYLGSGARAKRSADMHLKCRVFEELHPGKGVVLATATPVKNSALEVYTFLQHIAPQALAQRGVDTLEGFLDRYGRVEPRTIINARGEAQEADCFVGFQNLRELREITSQYMLIRDAKTVGLQVPAEQNQAHAVELTDNQKATMALLRQRLNDMLEGRTKSRGEVKGTEEADAEPGEQGDSGTPREGAAGIMAALDDSDKLETDHILKILHAMQVVSLDPAYDPTLLADYVNPKTMPEAAEAPPPQDLRSPKLERLVENITTKLDSGKAEHKPFGQVVFCDLTRTQHRIKDMLIAAGVPDERIGIINAKDAPSILERQAVAKAFQMGEIDVVIGNTATMGEGVNLQKRGSDLHHADIPWDPGSMIQRNGRTVRQGNPNSTVGVHTYMGKGSFDGYKLSSIGGKGDWLHHLWNGTSDEIEVPAEVQGFTRDQLFVYSSADPEKAVEELEASKRKSEAEAADKKYEKAMQVYFNLRSMYQSLQAAPGKRDPTVVKARKDTIEQLKRALAANPYFPHKDELTDEALAGPALVVKATGLVVKEGMNLQYSRGNDSGRTYYFRVTQVTVNADGSGKVRGHDYGNPLELRGDFREYDLPPGYLDLAKPALRGPEKAIEMGLEQLKSPTEAQSLPRDIKSENAAAIQATLRRVILAKKIDPKKTEREHVVWTKEGEGAPRDLVKLPEAEIQRLAKKGAGQVEFWVGSDQDIRDTLRYRDEWVEGIAKGQRSWDHRISQALTSYDVGRLSRESGLPGAEGFNGPVPKSIADMPLPEFLRWREAEAKGTGSPYSEGYNKGVWETAQQTAMTQGRIPFAEFRARVSPETVAKAIDGGLRASASWILRDDVSADPAVATALQVVKANKVAVAKLQRFNAVTSYTALGYELPGVTLPEFEATYLDKNKQPYQVPVKINSMVMTERSGTVEVKPINPWTVTERSGIPSYENERDVPVTDLLARISDEDLAKFEAAVEASRGARERQAAEAERIRQEGIAKAAAEAAARRLTLQKLGSSFAGKAKELGLTRDLVNVGDYGKEATIYSRQSASGTFWTLKFDGGSRGSGHMTKKLEAAGCYFNNNPKYLNWLMQKGKTPAAQEQFFTKIMEENNRAVEKVGELRTWLEAQHPGLRVRDVISEVSNEDWQKSLGGVPSLSKSSRTCAIVIQREV